METKMNQCVVKITNVHHMKSIQRLHFVMLQWSLWKQKGGKLFLQHFTKESRFCCTSCQACGKSGNGGICGCRPAGQGAHAQRRQELESLNHCAQLVVCIQVSGTEVALVWHMLPNPLGPPSNPAVLKQFFAILSSFFKRQNLEHIVDTSWCHVSSECDCNSEACWSHFLGCRELPLIFVSSRSEGGSIARRLDSIEKSRQREMLLGRPKKTVLHTKCNWLVDCAV